MFMLRATVEPPETVEKSLPPILAMALQDDEAVKMVKKTGIKLDTANLKALDSLPAGGRISHALENWNIVAHKNKFVLKVVEEGYKIDFLGKPPIPMNLKNHPTDPEGRIILDQEVTDMREKGAIRRIPDNKDGVVSPFFARPKPGKPGKWRPILDMKQVNKFVRYVKFKMTTVWDVKKWLKKDSFMTSLDLSDAYFSIPLHKSAYRFVRFVWQDLTYEFLTNMFGLGPSARLFTKVLAPVVRFLRRALEAQVTGYIDDFLQQDEDKNRCAAKTRAAVIIFHCLGFKVNAEKSEIEPTKHIMHPGFEWDTHAMTVTLPATKVEDLKSKAAQIKETGGITIKQLQSFLGKLEATKPAISTAPLHFRFLQALLPKRLENINNGTFLPLNKQAKKDLDWWTNSMHMQTSSPLNRGEFSLTLKTDASGLWGWGGHSARGASQGTWNGNEKAWHVNLKELEAGKRCLEEQMHNGDHVLLEMDSAVAVAFVNRMGGTRSAPLRDKALELWDLVLGRQGWVTARWLPREQNQIADLLSKEQLARWEFGLNSDQIDSIKDTWGEPKIDLFASARFHITQRYCSLEADPQADKIDAFRLEKWSNWSYAFPPMPLLEMTLDRIKKDQVKVIVVMPHWTEALWWTKVEQMRDSEVLRLGWYKDILQGLTQTTLPRLGVMVAVLLNGKKSHSARKPETS